MLFKQLFENESCTYTYLISCPDKKEAVLIDPVIETIERDLHILKSHGLKLTYAIDTHIHADHVTSASALREITNCKVAGPANDNLKCRDYYIYPPNSTFTFRKEFKLNLERKKLKKSDSKKLFPLEFILTMIQFHYQLMILKKV